MHNSSQTILHLLRKRAVEAPDAIAIVHEPSRQPASALSYLALWQRVNAAAAQIGAHGMEGDRVVLLFPSGPDFVEAFLGCMLARRIAVPAAVPRNERAQKRTLALIRDSGARMIVTPASMLLKLQAALNGLRVADDEAPMVIAVDAQEHGAPEHAPECSAGDTAFLQYTSGSTSHPKGVVVSHGNLTNNLGHIEREFGFSSSTCLVNWLPAYHDMGLIGGILAPIFTGCSTILMSPSEFIQRPLKWLELITKHRGTISGAPNFAYDSCVARIRDEDLEHLDLSSWRVAFNGSEPIRAGTLDKFEAKFARCGFDKRAFLPCYGLAESTLLVTGRATWNPFTRISLDREQLRQGRAAISDPDSGRTLVGCGAPNSEHEVAIVNPATKTRCAEDETGEVWLSGPSVCKGYWNRAEETIATFEAELVGAPPKKFLRTGDLGIVRDGQLFITGRRKNIVIIRGLNYACEDIEDLAQASHPAVTAAPGAAFGVEGESSEEMVIAQEINRRYLDHFDGAEVAAAIQESIVLHHGIRASGLVLVQPGTLPRTTSGKLQRHKARELYLSGQLRLVTDPDRSGVRGTPSGAQGEG